MKRVISFLSEVRSYYFLIKRPVGRMFTKSILISLSKICLEDISKWTTN